MLQSYSNMHLDEPLLRPFHLSRIHLFLLARVILSSGLVDLEESITLVTCPNRADRTLRYLPPCDVRTSVLLNGTLGLHNKSSLLHTYSLSRGAPRIPRE